MKKAASLLVLALASIALVACGSSNSTTTTTQPSANNGAPAGGAGNAGKAAKGGETVKLSTDPSGQLKYATAALTAKAGNVTIDLDNTQAISHDVAVEDSSGTVLGKSDLVAQGTSSVTLDSLKPGTYTYFCTVPGHQQAGMQGTLTVK